MLQEQHPYIDSEGIEHNELIKHYSDEGLPIIQLETGEIYEEAIDIYPCQFSYEELIPDDVVPNEDCGCDIIESNIIEGIQ